MASMGPEARNAIPTLVDGAISGDRHAAIACEALARLEPTADELPFDKLRDAMMKTKSPGLVAVVGHCGPKAAEVIASLWDDPNGVGVEMESAIQAYFEQAGAAASGAVAKLVPRLLTGDQDSASSASRALASIGEPSAEPLGEAFREQLEREGLSEDEVRVGKKEVQDLTDEAIKRIDEIGEEKIEEIMAI